jgi:hypothetical protein
MSDKNSTSHHRAGTRPPHRPGLSPRFSLTPAVMLLASSVLYLSPALWAEAPMALGYKNFVLVPFAPESRLLAALIASGMFVVASIQWQKLSFERIRGLPHERYILTAGFACLLLYTLSTPELFQGNKTVTLEATNKFHAAFYNICILMVVSYALDRRMHKSIPICGAAGLLIAIYIGHRSYTAVALISVGYIALRNRSLITIKLRYFAGAAAALLVLALYKSMYIAIKIGDYAFAASALSPHKIGTSLQAGMEQFLIFRVFDMIIRTDFQAHCTNLKYMPLFFVPFTDSLVNYQTCSTNAQIQSTLFAHYNGGVASNIWGEFFSVFGYAGFFLVPIALLGLARLAEWGLRHTSSPIMGAGLVIAVVQLTFYVQRNDLMVAITLAKRGVLLAAGLYVVSWLAAFLTSPRPAPATRST